MSTTPPITIFIHGTVPPDPVLAIPLVQRFFQCPKGLISLSDVDDCHTKDILTKLCSKYPKEYPQEHCYMFGWSGILKHAARKAAAFDLYKELADLSKDYTANGMAPRLHVVTHSHGGNVALCLKNVSEKYNNHANLSIDKLILLACPIQMETADYINDKIFKKVYSIHSHQDLLQIIDPQGFHTFLENLKNFGLEFTLSNLKELGPLFSERHFPKNSAVTQLNVKYPHRDLLHIEFLLPEFIQALPTLINKMKNHTDNTELTHVLNGEDTD